MNISIREQQGQFHTPETVARWGTGNSLINLIEVPETQFHVIISAATPPRQRSMYKSSVFHALKASCLVIVCGLLVSMSSAQPSANSVAIRANDNRVPAG